MLKRIVFREAKGPIVEGKCLVIQRDFQWGVNDFCTNVSPPHRCGAVPANLSSCGSKLRGNFLKGSEHPDTPT